MRKKIIEELIKELYGPEDGSTEIVDSYPLNKYMTGVIIPENWESKEENRSPDNEILMSEEGPLNEDDYTDEDISPTIPSELNPQIRSKSFGISFVVTDENPSLDVCVTWGRYFEQKIDKKKVWKRKPYYKICDSLEFNKKQCIYNEDDGQIYLFIRKKFWKNKYHITLSLVNNLESHDERGPSISSCIFQPSIRIFIKNDTSVDTEEIFKDAISFIYRKKLVKARGHMCSAIWKDVDYFDEEIFNDSILWPDGEYFEECSKYSKPDLRTEFIPMYPMPAPDYEWDTKYGKEPKFSASILSEIWFDDDIKNNLDPLVQGYKSWIDFKIKENQDNNEISKEIIENQLNALNRIQKGIDILINDENARLAFCFANKTISEQYKWKKDDFKWRPFQLSFLLMNIESICDKKSEFRNILDLLWIPTGGGKTEAYMGLIAFTIALRRINALKGISSSRTGAGTAIISRYTLRLLTVQQFRRTLKMITAAEYLRVKPSKNGKIGWRPDQCDFDEDWIYGSSRFSVGMWVGGAVSPNHIRTKGENIGAIDALRGQNANGEPAQVITCPVCGTFLAVPQKGIPRGLNKLHIVAKLFSEKLEFNDEINKLIKSVNYLKNIKISDNNHKTKYITITLELNANKELNKRDLEIIWNKIKNEIPVKEESLSLDRPGYFGSAIELGRRNDKFGNFEIWCTNPDCNLNNNVIWKEGIPTDNIEKFDFPDGLVENNVISPFISNSRIPIPAYTVDEQIYSYCPTVIISTADKIARLAFEPRAASIFGNIDKYNSCYGFHRGIYPYGPNPLPTKNCSSKNINVEPFEPPELIIQDELHLIDGPLGSMFGLYESAVDGLIKKAGGNPKYIASTATIKNAEAQVNLLYSKSTFQFPPYGLTIDDSFFVKDVGFKDGWGKKQKGRIFMGIYSPGFGPLYPLVIMWARLLRTTFKYRKENEYKKELNYFWTIVGYYNAIRELGGALALYRDDIESRLNEISKNDNEKRELDQDRIIDLSSNSDSTQIPIILNELEMDGDKDLNKKLNKKHPFYDAIFTTSMFGTGVDIPHLSLMVVNGQPKTTGSYIQATGRIGRSYGGLVVTFLRAGRPRDLSHYEMFTTYHHRIHQEVEPVSVSPFSRGALWRGAGPSSVSFLRNMHNPSVKWLDNDGNVICNDGADSDREYLINHIKERLKFIYRDKQPEEREKICKRIIKNFTSELGKWHDLAEVNDYDFVEYCRGLPNKDVILGDPPHKKYGKKVVFKNAPQSLREIEETIGFWVSS